jgi:ubiquinone/menaquinone biosynthesis C-methylase UbiE
VAEEVRHPLFARVFHGLSRLMEREAGQYLDDVLAGLTGRVLEVGAGNGINFRHYPATVEEVVAVEPESYLRAKAQDSARDAPVRVTVSEAVAGELPFDDGTFDAAVASLVLCSVPDQERALAELRRVMRDGAELRFFEHVLAERPRKARVQRTMDRTGVWPRVAGGCHCARDTRAAIERSGFRIERVRAVTVGPGWVLTNPHVVGVARA